MGQTYKDQVTRYQKKDGFFALTLWVAVMAIYTIFGLFGGNLFGGNFASSIVTNCIIAALCIVLVFASKERLSSIGLGGKNLRNSLMFGLILGVLAIFTIGVLPVLVNGFQFQSADSLIITFFYQLAVISFVEEIIYRGYIQSRLYGLFKRDLSAMLMGAVLFSTSHIPFQLASGNRVFDGDFIIWLALLMIIHLIFNMAYIKYHSLWGVIVLHALNNFGNEISYGENAPLDWNIIYLPILICVVVVAYVMNVRKQRKTATELFSR